MAETSFKFFLQFLLYGSLFTVYILIVMAIFVAELSREVSSKLHLPVSLAPFRVGHGFPFPRRYHSTNTF